MATSCVQMKWPLAQGSAVSPEWLGDILAVHPNIVSYVYMPVHVRSIPSLCMADGHYFFGGADEEGGWEC